MECQERRAYPGHSLTIVISMTIYYSGTRQGAQFIQVDGQYALSGIREAMTDAKTTAVLPARHFVYGVGGTNRPFKRSGRIPQAYERRAQVRPTANRYADVHQRR